MNIGDSIMVLMPGRKRAVEYVIVSLDVIIPDAVRAARPSRKWAGDFSSGVHTILTEWIVP